MTEDKIYRPAAAADYLGIGLSTLYEYAKNGDIPKAIKIGKRASGWRHSTLEKFLNSRPSQS
jgi:excisionase family DNA binding protein